MMEHPSLEHGTYGYPQILDPREVSGSQFRRSEWTIGFGEPFMEPQACVGVDTFCPDKVFLDREVARNGPGRPLD